MRYQPVKSPARMTPPEVCFLRPIATPLTFRQCSLPLASVGLEGFEGMITVDKIGRIRRAFFERHLPIKEIVRTLSVSRATVRKVIRGTATEFRYERGVQPTPKLGEWVEVLLEILEKEAGLPRRERRSGNLRVLLFRPRPRGEEPRRAERLAGRSVHRLRRSNQPSGVQGPDDLGRIPG
jgi:hypothetical protein